LPGGTKENHENPVTIAGLRAEKYGPIERLLGILRESQKEKTLIF
jgi:hypothetical protein